MCNSFLSLTKTNIMVEFSIFGDSFEPTFITEKLSITPSEFWLMGDKIPKCNNMFRKETCWTVCSGYKEELYIEKEINNILLPLIVKKDTIVHLINQLNLTCKITIVIKIKNNETPALYLNKNIIKFANDVGAEFDFDLYVM